jgi:hypothetical protein
MPLGVLEHFDTEDYELLYDTLATAQAIQPASTIEYAALAKAMSDAREPDAVEAAIEYSESELRTLYVLLARASCNYAVDSEEFHVLTKAMADFRKQM